ncbi:MAG: SDR family oxidoreductase [Caldilineaceae bacterium]|nr:SDR family oxidoreductase [Caldilineaceae bacterium]
MYLVTGGAGFIGSNLVEALLARGERVRVLDNLSTGRAENLAAMLDQIEFIEGDIRSYHLVAEAVEGVDFVLHQAALPSVPRSVRDPITSNEVNVIGTLNVLDAARKAGVRRLVAASSSSVYGDNPALPKEECMELRPLSPYAVSKLATELHCQLFTRLYGFETVSLRYFNVFGPRQDPSSQYSAVIPRFISAMLADRPLTVHGDGSQSRDFSYIDNVVDANLRAALAPQAAGAVVNIACGERHSLLDLIDQLGQIIGREARIEHTNARVGDVPHSLADITLAGKLLGYEPQAPFATGLRKNGGLDAGAFVPIDHQSVNHGLHGLHGLHGGLSVPYAPSA